MAMTIAKTITMATQASDGLSVLSLEKSSEVSMEELSVLLIVETSGVCLIKSENCVSISYCNKK